MQINAANERAEQIRKKKWWANLGIGVTEFDSNVPYELVFESDGHDAGDGFDDRRFPVCDMSDRTCARRQNAGQYRHPNHAPSVRTQVDRCLLSFNRPISERKRERDGPVLR